MKVKTKKANKVKKTSKKMYIGMLFIILSLWFVGFGINMYIEASQNVYPTFP